MIEFSENSMPVDEAGYRSFKKIGLIRHHIIFRRWLMILLAVLLGFLFLPWTQNIRAKGKVTTLLPDQRPQTIHTTIAGRIEAWYVREGQLVHKGDTILRLSEIKTDYFDTRLLERTQAQRDAKSNTVSSYGSKARSLEAQVAALSQELLYKKQQLEIRIQQTTLKAEGEKNELNAADIDVETEKIQLERSEAMYVKGLLSKTGIENKRLKYQQAVAKQTVAQNKYAQSLQEVENLKTQRLGIESEYKGKISKSESERFSTISEQYDALATVNKLDNQYSNYAARSTFYVITAPRDCYINRAKAAGIGETVKEGEPVVSITPANLELAVELFIEPIDLPLVSKGTPVRLVFDGWPFLVFSGWPGVSQGTFSGIIVAVDNVADETGKFRLLVAPDPASPAWPSALRPGGGARGYALLNDVPLWYEMWRQFNGFPPEYYKQVSSSMDVPKSEK